MTPGDTGERRLRRGDPFSASWTFSTGSGPFDVTVWGSSVRAQLRSFADDEAFVDFDVTADLPAGSLTLSLPPDRTAMLKPGAYVWDAQTVKADGSPGPTILCGSIVLERDVTR